MSKHRALPQLKIGDPIVLQDPKSGLWDKRGKICDIRENGKSYWVETIEGDYYLRGRAMIRNDILSVTDEQTDERTKSLITGKQIDRQTDDTGDCDIRPTRKESALGQSRDETDSVTVQCNSRAKEGTPASRTRSKTTTLKSVTFNK